MQRQPLSDECVAPLPVSTGMDTGINPADLTSCCSVCCVISSCYCKCPQCLGVQTKGVICCCETEGACCKVGVKEGSCWYVRDVWVECATKSCIAIQGK